jgi:hypothetical protein
MPVLRRTRVVGVVVGRTLPGEEWSVSLTPTYAGYLRGRGTISRRLNPASCYSPCSFFVKPGFLAALHRASPVPFRASCFTSGLHPPPATAQQRTDYLYSRWSYGLTPFRSFHHRASWRTPVLVPVEQLDPVAALVLKDENVPGQRVVVQLLPHLGGQPVEATA